jgi:hypothetical protein
MDLDEENNKSLEHVTSEELRKSHQFIVAAVAGSCNAVLQKGMHPDALS